MANAVSGSAAKVMAPVTNLAGKAMDDVSGVAKSGIQTAGKTISGVSSGVDNAVSHVLTPLSSGIGGGINSLGSGLGEGIAAFPPCSSICRLWQEWVSSVSSSWRVLTRNEEVVGTWGPWQNGHVSGKKCGAWIKQ